MAVVNEYFDFESGDWNPFVWFDDLVLSDFTSRMYDDYEPKPMPDDVYTSITTDTAFAGSRSLKDPVGWWSLVLTTSASGNLFTAEVIPGEDYGIGLAYRIDAGPDDLDLVAVWEWFDSNEESLGVDTVVLAGVTTGQWHAGSSGSSVSNALLKTAPANAAYVLFTWLIPAEVAVSAYYDEVRWWGHGTAPPPEPEPPLSSILRTGFRFPHPRWSRRSTATNLLFLETQLEKYMHSHEGEEEPGVIPL